MPYFTLEHLKEAQKQYSETSSFTDAWEDPVDAFLAIPWFIRSMLLQRCIDNLERLHSIEETALNWDDSYERMQWSQLELLERLAWDRTSFPYLQNIYKTMISATQILWEYFKVGTHPKTADMIDGHVRHAIRRVLHDDSKKQFLAQCIVDAELYWEKYEKPIRIQAKEWFIFQNGTERLSCCIRTFQYIERLRSSSLRISDALACYIAFGAEKVEKDLWLQDEINLGDIGKQRCQSVFSIAENFEKLFPDQGRDLFFQLLFKKICYSFHLRSELNHNGYFFHSWADTDGISRSLNFTDQLEGIKWEAMAQFFEWLYKERTALSSPHAVVVDIASNLTDGLHGGIFSTTAVNNLWGGILGAAAEIGGDRLVTRMLKTRSDEITQEDKDKALYYSVRLGHIEVTKALLDSGASPCKEFDLEFIKKFLFRTDFEYQKCIVNNGVRLPDTYPLYRNKTSLLYAIDSGHTKIVQEIIISILVDMTAQPSNYATTYTKNLYEIATTLHNVMQSIGQCFKPKASILNGGLDENKLPDAFESKEQAAQHIETLHLLFAGFRGGEDPTEMPLVMEKLSNTFNELFILINFPTLKDLPAPTKKKALDIVKEDTGKWGDTPDTPSDDRFEDLGIKVNSLIKAATLQQDIIQTKEIFKNPTSSGTEPYFLTEEQQNMGALLLKDIKAVNGPDSEAMDLVKIELNTVYGPDAEPIAGFKRYDDYFEFLSSIAPAGKNDLFKALLIKAVENSQAGNETALSGEDIQQIDIYLQEPIHQQQLSDAIIRHYEGILNNSEITQSSQSEVFEHIIKCRAHVSTTASAVCASGTIKDTAIQRLQASEQLWEHACDLSMTVLLCLPAVGAVGAGLSKGVEQVHHFFEQWEENTKIIKEGAELLEGAMTAVEAAEALPTGTHVIHSAGHSIANLTAAARGVRKCTTDDWHKNMVGTTHYPDRLRDYIGCFCKAFSERYIEQLNLLSPAQTVVLAHAVWEHLESAARYGYLISDSATSPLKPAEFARYALDWLAYFPMEKTIILPGVEIKGHKHNLSADAFLRGPGMRCLDGTLPVYFTWKESDIVLGETVKEDYSSWKTTMFKHHHCADLLGHRCASANEVEHLENGGGRPFTVRFGAKEIVKLKSCQEDTLKIGEEPIAIMDKEKRIKNITAYDIKWTDTDKQLVNKAEQSTVEALQEQVQDLEADKKEKDQIMQSQQEELISLQGSHLICLRSEDLGVEKQKEAAEKEVAAGTAVVIIVKGEGEKAEYRVGFKREDNGKYEEAPMPLPDKQGDKSEMIAALNAQFALARPASIQDEGLKKYIYDFIIDPNQGGQVNLGQVGDLKKEVATLKGQLDDQETRLKKLEGKNNTASPAATETSASSTNHANNPTTVWGERRGLLAPDNHGGTPTPMLRGAAP